MNVMLCNVKLSCIWLHYMPRLALQYLFRIQIVKPNNDSLINLKNKVCLNCITYSEQKSSVKLHYDSSQTLDLNSLVNYMPDYKKMKWDFKNHKHGKKFQFKTHNLSKLYYFICLTIVCSPPSKLSINGTNNAPPSLHAAASNTKQRP